ncbi:MAG: CBS domain-containing protein [Candidatus Aenigmatarchaeota archaeon]
MVELEKVGILGNKRIVEIASLNPIYCFDKESIFQVSEKFSKFGFRSFPVVDKNKKLVGIVTITDILDAFLKKEDFFQEISKIMSREVVFVEDRESIRIVLQKMKISKRGRLPVVGESNKVVGIISETDFLKKSSDFSIFEKIKIEEVMTKKPFCVFSKNTILETIRIMVNAKYRRLPVIENGELVGYITSTRLFSKLFENKFSENFVKKPISEIMTKEPIFVEPSESLKNALEKMKNSGISSILIVNNKKIEGIFTERDYINLLE